MNVNGILSFLSGISFFLFGMYTLGKGLEKSTDGKLQGILGSLCKNTFRAVLLGAFVTALIQSSSAVTVMVIGFVSSGLMTLHQSVGVIMGANLGTTVTPWILSLAGVEGTDSFLSFLTPAFLSPVAAFLGVILIFRKKHPVLQNAGQILLGFALLLTGMEMMSDAVAPLSENERFTGLLTWFSNPVIGLAVGALLTAVMQSSSASIGILQAFATTGAFTYRRVLPIIMGQNIGTCITALLSGIGASVNARRTAFVHLYFNLIGSLSIFFLFFGADYLFSLPIAQKVVTIADIALIHTLFNLFSTILLLPFTRFLEFLAVHTVREKQPKAGSAGKPEPAGKTGHTEHSSRKTRKARKTEKNRSLLP